MDTFFCHFSRELKKIAGKTREEKKMRVCVCHAICERPQSPSTPKEGRKEGGLDWIGFVVSSQVWVEFRVSKSQRHTFDSRYVFGGNSGTGEAPVGFVDPPPVCPPPLWAVTPPVVSGLTRLAPPGASRTPLTILPLPVTVIKEEEKTPT